MNWIMVFFKIFLCFHFLKIYLQLAAGVEFLETVDRLLSVDHRGHALALLSSFDREGKTNKKK